MGHAAGEGVGDGDVAALLQRLPERYRPKPGAAALRARVRIVSGRLRRDVVVDEDGCRVERCDGARPDVEVVAEPGTWRDIWDGRLSGIEAFARHRLVMRGSIDKALCFEPLFERPDAGGLRYDVRHLDTGRARLATLVAGDPGAPPVVLLHGLGATKSSWLTVVPALARRHRVLVVDLPGFGGSSKPLGRYDAAFLAGHVDALLDVTGYGRVLLGGNSMGGRVAIEVALRHPERVAGVACLCPAAAFTRRPVLPVVRLLRPELGILAARLPRRTLISGLRDLFADPRRVDDTWFEAAVDDFLDTWRSPRARIAFCAAARQIYLDEPQGDAGFWARLAELAPPTLCVYGARDVLITARFADKVSRCLPTAEVHVWDDCGHVPQIEHPERTQELMLDFFARCAAGRPAAEAG